VIDRPDAYEVLREAVETGKLVMLRTHVNIDEVLDTGTLTGASACTAHGRNSPSQCRQVRS
jgi:hypothetical protein